MDDVAPPTGDAAVSASNGHGGPGGGVAVTGSRPVVLLRYRPGVVGETARTVHVVPLPPMGRRATDGQAGAVSALCGARLMLTDVEPVTPWRGYALRRMRDHDCGRAATRGRPGPCGRRGAWGWWGLLSGVGLAGEPAS